MNNKGSVLLETVVSLGFISIILLSSFIVINSIINKNSKLYDVQMERKTINSVYSKIANDFYRYNILYYDCYDNMCEFESYRSESDLDGDIKYWIDISVEENGLKYNNEIIKNNSAVKFKSVSVNLNNNILKLSINYNDNKKMDIYSINYKGD